MLLFTRYGLLPAPLPEFEAADLQVVLEAYGTNHKPKTADIKLQTANNKPQTTNITQQTTNNKLNNNIAQSV